MTGKDIADLLKRKAKGIKPPLIRFGLGDAMLGRSLLKYISLNQSFSTYFSKLRLFLCALGEIWGRVS